MDGKKLKGAIAVIGSYSIFGLSAVFTKDLTNSGVFSPSALLTVRTGGALLLFWLLSLFTPEEKIQKGDHFRIFLGSLIGLFIPQFASLIGITMSTPVDISLISSLKPILTLIVACILLGEKLSLKKLAGMLLGLAGAVVMLYFGAVNKKFGTSLPGFLILMMNGISFSFYLVLFRPLIKKYSAVTYLKWLFLFTFILSLPFSAKSLLAAQFSALTPSMYMELAFMIVCATFIAYFLTPIGQKNLHPTSYSIFSYFQLIVAALASLAFGLDVFSWTKLLSAALMIAGVLIVIRN